MRNILLAISIVMCSSLVAQEKPDTMWVQFNDRFVENEIISLDDLSV